ncbi:MAG: TetR/AcrR family transcriptional regulator [Spirochaeta sp.]|jgi:AcrR family transcriptional regulator|nr:TetR/AcrR family transcriptional regulator [Spirochaeta sp.]
MAPKTQFSKDQIIEAAFRIACRDGMDGITVRKIAAELGSSVAPVYVNFSDLEGVRDAVVDRIVHISREILEETGTGRPFRDIGLASIRFARRYPVISRDLTLRPNRYLGAYRSRMDDSLAGRMEADPDLAELSPDQRRELLFRMQVFQTGLTVMTSTGQLPQDTTETELTGIMERAAEDFIAAELRRTREENS